MGLDEFARILGATVVEEKLWSVQLTSTSPEPLVLGTPCDHGGATESLVVPIANSDGSICVECGEEF